MKGIGSFKQQEAAPINSFEAFAFHYRDITIDWYIRESLDLAAGQRPADFKFFDLRSRPQPQDYARIVRREKASPACLQAGSP